MSHPDWTGRTAVVIANGPSLTDYQCGYVTLSPCAAIAVNTAYIKMPGANVFYAGDFLLWRVHSARIKGLAAGQCWTCDATAAEHFGIRRWKGVNDVGLGEKAIHMNGNSGAQAINLAYLFGARKIVLLGFTMREINGKKHFHGDHEAPLVQKQLFAEWLWKMRFVAKDAARLKVDIVNCDELSAMDCFRRGKLEDEL